MRNFCKYLLLLNIFSFPARAEESDPWAVSAYWAAHNFKGLFHPFPTKWDGEYLASFGLKRRLYTLSGQDGLLAPLNGARLEAEIIAAQHFGQASFPEVAGYVLVRTPQFSPISGFSFNFGIGGGLSFDFAKHPFDEQSGKGLYSYTNIHMRVESEFTLDALPLLHLAFIIHHRSTAGGTVGAAGTGSNYYGVGLRHDL